MLDITEARDCTVTVRLPAALLVGRKSAAEGTVSLRPVKSVEAGSGIEPLYEDLQSSA